ncbi:MAG: hypothetical protein IPP90_09865 [Gemmatimonadaceae bacterium]|nr:hypothetical protein [Gemmatimonadaceae bacterium]
MIERMTRTTIWRLAYYLFFAVILGTAALNMRQVRGGFWTNHAADVFVPAWLYVASRGLHSTTGRTTLIQRTIGRTPEIAALTLFAASAATEVSQYYWPHGMFPGRFDWYDLLSYAAGLMVCFAADKLWPING